MTVTPDPDVSQAPATPAPTASSAEARGGRAGRPWHGARQAISSRWDILAVIAAGGALGSLARWGIEVALPHPPGAFPWSTFVANLTGCLLIGALMVMIADVWPPSRLARPFLGVGILGGYTTFSTYMLDTRELLMTGHAGLAGLYLAGTLAGGLACVWAGTALARAAVRGARGRVLRAAGREPIPAGPDHNTVRPGGRDAT